MSEYPKIQTPDVAPSPDGRKRNTVLSDGTVELTAAMFKVLGDPTRLRVLEVLNEQGSATGSSLMARLGITQQAVSKQLGILPPCRHRAQAAQRRMGALRADRLDRLVAGRAGRRDAGGRRRRRPRLIRAAPPLGTPRPNAVAVCPKEGDPQPLACLVVTTCALRRPVGVSQSCDWPPTERRRCIASDTVR